ncbi:MAG TPA: hypothetical protein GXX18_06035 [Bacillales bacterium]|nr:hypothetical protein [Bacillales bacterium]
MKLKKGDFHTYYDSGLGNPFDTQEVISFCIENQELFSEEILLGEGYCWMCDKEGLDRYYIIRFDTESHVEMFKKYVSKADEILKNSENDIQDISVVICKNCGKWAITH